jgi:hypothetical protein
MDSMTLTVKRQCTFKKQFLDHMGAKPGEKLVVKKLPDGSLKIQAKARAHPLSALQGCIESRINFSDEDIQNAIAQGYVDGGIKGFEL